MFRLHNYTVLLALFTLLVSIASTLPTHDGPRYRSARRGFLMSSDDGSVYVNGASGEAAVPAAAPAPAAEPAPAPAPAAAVPAPAAAEPAPAAAQPAPAAAAPAGVNPGPQAGPASYAPQGTTDTAPAGNAGAAAPGPENVVAGKFTTITVGPFLTTRTSIVARAMATVYVHA